MIPQFYVGSKRIPRTIEHRAVCVCTECEGCICEGETYWEIYGNIICDDCIDDFKRKAECDDDDEDDE